MYTPVSLSVKIKMKEYTCQDEAQAEINALSKSTLSATPSSTTSAKCSSSSNMNPRVFMLGVDEQFLVHISQSVIKQSAIVEKKRKWKEHYYSQ